MLQTQKWAVKPPIKRCQSLDDFISARHRALDKYQTTDYTSEVNYNRAIFAQN